MTRLALAACMLAIVVGAVAFTGAQSDTQLTSSGAIDTFEAISNKLGGGDDDDIRRFTVTGSASGELRDSGTSPGSSKQGTIAPPTPQSWPGEAWVGRPSGVARPTHGSEQEVGILQRVSSFLAGYDAFDRGNPAWWREHFVTVVIPCESSWRLDPPGAYLGLAQFDPRTWAQAAEVTGYTDWRDPYHQGVNVAYWASVVDPSGYGGWWECWRA